MKETVQSERIGVLLTSAVQKNSADTGKGWTHTRGTERAKSKVQRPKAVPGKGGSIGPSKTKDRTTTTCEKNPGVRRYLRDPTTGSAGFVLWLERKEARGKRRTRDTDTPEALVIGCSRETGKFIKKMVTSAALE